MTWWDSSWTKKKAITLTGGASGAQSSYQVKLTVSWESSMKSDFSDLRFTNGTEDTLLDAWMESHTASTSAIIWVETDTPANTVDADIFMYYGKADAVSDWDGTGTFPDLFDDFEDNDVTDWSGSTMSIESTVVKTGTYSGVATGVVGPYKTGASRTSDYNIDFDYRESGIGDRYFAIGNNGNYFTNCIFYRTRDGVLSYYNGTSYVTIMNLSNDTWYKFKTVVHFATNTFDLFIDDISRVSGGGTRGAISSHNDFDPVPNGQSEYFDNIFVHKYAASPPTYEFGTEESAPAGGSPMWYYNLLRRRNN